MKVGAKDETIELISGRLLLVIDKASGSIVRIEDRKTGLVHLDALREGNRGYGRLLHLIVPSGIWVSRMAETHLAPSPKIQRDGDGVTIVYPDLPARGQKTGIEVRVRIKLVPESDEARFTLQLENRGECPITEVVFPIIGGWTGVGGRGKDRMVAGASYEFDPHGFPINKGIPISRFRQRQLSMYAVSMYTPWFDLSGPAGGISYINYMTTPLVGGLYCENLAGYKPGLHLAFGWAFQPLIEPQTTWMSPPIGISVHGGDWHDTADKFNKWVEKWFKPAPTSRATRLSIGYQNVIFRGFDGMPVRGLETIPDVARDGRKYGVNHLAIWDYIISGNYGRADNNDLLDYSESEKEILRKGLAQAKAEGTNVSALINFRLANPMSAKYNAAEAVRNFDGSPRIEQWSGSNYHFSLWTPHLGPISYVLSPRSEGWRKRVLRQTKEYLDLGFTSMFYDQPFQYHPDYGEQEHGAPDEVYAECVNVIAEVRKMLAENDPEAYMIGEQCGVQASQYIDVWMSWYTDFEPVTKAAYALPYTINSYPVDSEPWKASRAFALGLQLCLTTHGCEETLAAEPAFAEHVAKLAALRKQCAARTVLGQFRHTRGLDLALDEGVAAFAYDSSEGPCVVTSAGEKGGRAKIGVNLRAFTKGRSKGKGTVIRLDGGREILADAEKIDLLLAPNEVVVVYC